MQKPVELTRARSNVDFLFTFNLMNYVKKYNHFVEKVQKATILKQYVHQCSIFTLAPSKLRGFSTLDSFSSERFFQFKAINIDKTMIKYKKQCLAFIINIMILVFNHRKMIDDH